MSDDIHNDIALPSSLVDEEAKAPGSTMPRLEDWVESSASLSNENNSGSRPTSPRASVQSLRSSIGPIVSCTPPPPMRTLVPVPSTAPATASNESISITPPTTPSRTKQQNHHQPHHQRGPSKSKKNNLPFLPPSSSSSAPAQIALANNNSNNHHHHKNSIELPVGDRVRLGICAMDKKARSKPMAEILSRLDETLFEVVFFGDSVILERDVEEWPICHVLVAFYSKNYPLEKAQQYAELRKPFILNDLNMQRFLKDRRRVYDLLEASGIDVPRHVYLSRDDYVSTGTGDGNGARMKEVVEYDDHIEVNGVNIHKPFVEKPVDADDHNIAIYYPSSAGGGCKKLFRKVGNRSSEFYPDINEVRRDGSYIYEEFVETQGTDVKMYTVGPEYGHAEARKSPAVDGKVERNSDGKEVRFPVILTLREKEIARRIVLVFRQFVCGFDLLRVQEGNSIVSYVCDVNGWSFVKNSRKYYDDCAQILAEHILAAVKPAFHAGFSTLDPLLTVKNEYDFVDQFGSSHSSTFNAQRLHKRTGSTLSRATRILQGEPNEDEDDEYESYTNLRHDSPTSSLAATVAASPSEKTSTAPDNLIISGATTLEEGAIPIREYPNHLTSEPASMCPSSASSQVDENETERRTRQMSFSGSHAEELRCVIAVIRHGDRTPKQKLKVTLTEPLILKYFQDHADDCRKDLKVKAKKPMTEFLETVKTIIANMEALEAKEDSEASTLTPNKSGGLDRTLQHKLLHMRDVLERWKIAGLNRKLQIKPNQWEEVVDEVTCQAKVRCTQVLLILKWGGNLTKLGEKQSVNLGQRLRNEMYPYSPGGGILRLHSTFRHDLKIKTSDEGRVMKTAAAFAKGFLELEGDLPPILVSLVHKEKASMQMLDPSGNKEVKAELDELKEKINADLQKDIEIRDISVEEREKLVGPRQIKSLHEALIRMGNPRRSLFNIHKTIGELLEQLEDMLGGMGSGDEKRIEGGEGLKGEHDDDIALSGVKLYKGETLLELTERWRFIYDRLYDKKRDVFDLSRIPDVHDNVRFDMLHNPHLGLTITLEKLYELAKTFADCVVPQEYGTTIAEKRSVGSKMCRALLEKIKYDLTIARTDNEADMRYMINMDYSADLQINTLGRRIRTRLYFTSESHLHTMLNVLRFACVDGNKQRGVLSESGIKFINGAPELCYLTQIVFRLFEDPRREMDDPKRFRVEIFFSPGATATPLHVHELDRDSDLSRFDTDPLKMVGREGLTCHDVEEFFKAAIVEGKTEEDHFEIMSASTVATKQIGAKKIQEGIIAGRASGASSHPIVGNLSEEDEAVEESMILEEENNHPDVQIDPKHFRAPLIEGSERGECLSSIGNEFGLSNHKSGELVDPVDEVDGADEEVGAVGKVLLRSFAWRTIALGSFALGVGCILLAVNVRMSRSPQGRRWSRR